MPSDLSSRNTKLTYSEDKKVLQKWLLINPFEQTINLKDLCQLILSTTFQPIINCYFWNCMFDLSSDEIWNQFIFIISKSRSIYDTSFKSVRIKWHVVTFDKNKLSEENVELCYKLLIQNKWFHVRSFLNINMQLKFLQVGELFEICRRPGYNSIRNRT